MVCFTCVNVVYSGFVSQTNSPPVRPFLDTRIDQTSFQVVFGYHGFTFDSSPTPGIARWAGSHAPSRVRPKLR